MSKKQTGLKYLLIVSPVSGTGVYKKHLDVVVDYFQKHNMSLDVRFTDYPGHARKIAAEDTSHDVIIGAGGDGTINEVVNGLAGSDKLLAVLPWGTANVFAREMGISCNPRSACKVIRKGHAAKLDLGMENDRYFLMMCSVGFDAYTLKNMQGAQLKGIFGWMAYIFAGLSSLRRYSHPTIRVRSDKEEETASFVLVSNTRRYGPYFKITPRAHPADGKLDVYLFREYGGWNILKFFARLIFSLFRKRPKGKKTVFFKRDKVFRVKSIEIFSESETPTQVDGDLSMNLPVTIKIVPAFINVILPKKSVKKITKKLKHREVEE